MLEAESGLFSSGSSLAGGLDDTQAAVHLAKLYTLTSCEIVYLD